MQHQRTVVGAVHPRHRDGHPGRRLVVHRRVRVHTRLGDEADRATGWRGPYGRLGQERGSLDLGDELRAELAERGELGPVVDQRERGHLPERVRAAVAEDDLVPVRQAEELGEPATEARDFVPYRRLAV